MSVGRRGTTLGVQHREAGVAWGPVNARQQIGGGLGAAVLSSSYATAVSSYVATSHGTSAAMVSSYSRRECK
jgi:hypothetical protein